MPATASAAGCQPSTPAQNSARRDGSALSKEIARSFAVIGAPSRVRPPVDHDRASAGANAPSARPRNGERHNAGVKQRLASTRLADGTEIAYATVGRGPLLVH